MKHKGITLFGLSGVLLFIFVPILFPIWFMFWVIKAVVTAMWNLGLMIPKLIVKAINHDKE